MFNLKEKYNLTIKSELQNELAYSNIHMVPQLQCIIINCGIGINANNKNFLQNQINNLVKITGQYPVITYAKASIAGFKIRKGMPLGLKVTLRKELMYNFLAKLILLALPQIRDFSGIQLKKVDSKNSISIGIDDLRIFPELLSDLNVDKFGGTIIFNFKSKSFNDSKLLLKKFGLPIKN